MAKGTESYWDFFKYSKEILGKQTFETLIRKYLNTNGIATPESYAQLMKLKPKGLVTLNLDSFAGEAFAKSNQTQNIEKIYGNELNRKHVVLSRELPWVLYLHGHIRDVETWILTSEEIKKALTDEGRDFSLKKLYTENIVLFYGMSIDDLSVSKTLSSLSKAGINTPHLYWFTSRDDHIASKWNEDHQIRPIYYKAEKRSDHLKNLKDFVKQIGGHRPVDNDKMMPIVSRFDSPLLNEQETDPDEIAGMEPNSTRLALSTLLYSKIKHLNGDELYDEFSKFLKDYDFPIRSRAFYVNKTKYNEFFDYKIITELGEGNFGRVYLAQDTSEVYFAIKIIREEIQNSKEMLGGFRRGIRSMQILKNNRVHGVVPIIKAYEMPPTIIMPHVDGQSLEEIFKNLNVMPWGKKIDVILEVAKVVHSCHRLPETVLHRDLKPSNIMITNFDWDTGDFAEAVVLDFDMSWHKGSDEKDIIFESRDDFGYLAPEQTNPNSEFLARSAKVDSFGLAMTLFAILGGEHPRPDISMDENRWSVAVKRAVGRGFHSDIGCLKNRICRIILAATKKEQNKRLGFLYLLRRLEMVSKVVNRNPSLSELDVLLEQIMFMIAEGKDYTWDDMKQEGKLSFVSGISANFSVNSNSTIEFDFRYQDPGNVDYSKRNQALNKSKSIFTSIRDYGIYSAKTDVDLQNQFASYKMTLDSKVAFEQIDIFPTFFAAFLAPLKAIQ